MTSIADYALLGDCHGSALVSGAGSVDWWCPPRFDAPAVFSRLLDQDAGHWSITPVGEYTARRRYLDATMVLETEFSCPGGTVRLTDALALGSGERGHDIGLASPHLLVRRVEVLDGQAELAVEFRPRPEFGLVTPHVTPSPTGLQVIGGAERLTLTADLDFTVAHGTATGSVSLSQGQHLTLSLQHRRSVDPAPAPLDADAMLTDTVAGWCSWAELHDSYRGPYRDDVMRSALVLQALTYRPTGAIVAAPTAGLPEQLGGSANWDYRFGWLRDGSLTLKALWVAACPDEARGFFTWIADSAGPLEDAPLPIMFGVGGEHDLTEHALPHLGGYAASRPVRVGNDAWRQVQLDVLGEVLECAWILRDQLGELSTTTARFLRSVADRAAATWTDQDAGIWEGRDGDRDYVTSKLMCWVALDRAVRLADRLGPEADVDTWTRARDEVRTAVLERGWSSSAGAFTGAFGSDHLDAGVLLLPLVGFLPPDDDRVLATLDAVERELGPPPLLQRWTSGEDQGAFLTCSYWLSAARAMAGHTDRARELFEATTAYANDVGLLSEEVDRERDELIGNYPQGLSHIALINAAWAIAQAETEHPHAAS